MPRGARALLPLHFTNRRTRNMTTRLLLLQSVCVVLLAGAAAEPAPAPGRVPKVYNALITSNQNLEPSKAYPVYQPVIHDPFAYPFQPTFFYGDYSIGNNLNPTVVAPPQEPKQPSPPALPPADSAPPSSESPPKEPSPQESSDQSTPAPPPAPSTQSPIPLNQFGLPSQVLPLGQFNPAYDGFTQIGPINGPLTYSYPGLRFYDPYSPFNLNPYANLPPFYRPLPSVFTQGQPGTGQPPAPPASLAPPADQPNPPADSSTPPPEPSDLNALNYSSKDPSIPNVPPPPLPQGGLRDDKTE